MAGRGVKEWWASSSPRPSDGLLSARGLGSGVQWLR